MDRDDNERRCINCARPESPVVVPQLVFDGIKRAKRRGRKKGKNRRQ
jgi:hypothetical protein